MEDPSLSFRLDEESGQNLIGGLGELHLEIVCDKLRRRFDINVDIGDAYVGTGRRCAKTGAVTKSLLRSHYRHQALFAEATLETRRNAEVPSVVVSNETVIPNLGRACSPGGGPRDPR